MNCCISLRMIDIFIQARFYGCLIIVVLMGAAQLTIHDSRNWIYYTDMTGFSPEAADTLRAFEQGYKMGSLCAGINCRPNKQWARQQWLLKNLTQDEFRVLRRSYHVKTKAVAYLGLIQSDKKNAYRLLCSAASREELVYISAGCHGMHLTIAEYILSPYFGLPSGPPVAPDKLASLDLDADQCNTILHLYQQTVIGSN
jgi:hypothetical protein